MEPGPADTAGREVGAGSGPPIWAPGYRHLTRDVEPVPFRFRVRPVDFRVEEVPLELPSGAGTHVHIEIEKCGLSTVDAVRRLAAALGRSGDDFGFAGRKDAFAVTRQWISLEHVDPAVVAALRVPDLEVLRVVPHTRKLRLGQLAGNRFRLRLVGLDPGHRPRVERVLASLERSGLPNYYGAQRFGRNGLTYRLGRLLVQGRWKAYLEELLGPDQTRPDPAVQILAGTLREGSRSAQRRLGSLAPELPPDLAPLARQWARRPGDLPSALRALPKRTRRFHLSAFQSRIFNRVLARRLAEGLPLDGLVAGDVSVEEATGRTRLHGEDLNPEPELRRRVERFECSPTGPMPGTHSPLASGLPGRLEAEALAAEDVRREDFHGLPEGLAQKGARRPLRVPVSELETRWTDGALQLAFRLPKGAFATTLLEELRKDFRPAEPTGSPRPTGSAGTEAT